MLSRHGGEAIRYIIIGGLTTAVSFGMFTVFLELIHLGEVPSKMLSGICAILFAYIPNKFFVFKRRCDNAAQLFLEFIKFVGGRLVIWGLEVGCFVPLVTLLGLNAYVSWVLSTVLNIVGNYFISKFLVFRKRAK